LAFDVNFQNTDACGSNSKNAVALKKQYDLGNYGKKQHGRLCPSRFRSSFKIQFLHYILAKSKQMLY
jgi:hypothetical protein